MPPAPLLTTHPSIRAHAQLGYAAEARTHVALLSFPPCPSSWAADGPFCKNESYILNVVLPFLRTTYGATGPISLLGFAQGGACVDARSMHLGYVVR